MSLLLTRSAPISRALRLRHSPSTCPPSRLLHVRTVSAFAGPGGRIAGWVVRKGAMTLGVGGAAGGGLMWAQYKVDGITSGIRGWLGDTTDTLGSTINTLSSSASDTFSSLSTSAGDTANELSGRLADFQARLRARFAARQQEEDAVAERRDEEGRGGSTGPTGKGTAAVAAALGASLPIVVDAEEQPTPPGVLVELTKRLIEIRTILQSIGDSTEAGLTLPSIVVVGSQSSGKSSVLEAIVGQEFLPKGNNMVTRCPIELTLVHTPPTASDPSPTTYAQFPSLGPGRITDFRLVQKTLLDLNLAIPPSECVSDVPIYLTIHSPHVPDLSLVDLPGYVEISARDQPEELKDKIAGLCEKYIRAPNIILAVCAANVDLANSPALSASKRVDLDGKRTIAVVTKMDLVPPSRGAEILSDTRYRSAAFVGVVCKAAPTALGTAVVGPTGLPESPYFRENAAEFEREGLLCGTGTLVRRLEGVLETSMAASLTTISDNVTRALRRAVSDFQVKYSGHAISAESYAAEVKDTLKAQILDLGREFNKADVRKLLKAALDDEVLNILSEYYWVDPAAPQLKVAGDTKSVTPADLDLYWRRKLDASTNDLTTSGVGRNSTALVVDALRARLAALGAEEPLVAHPGAVARLDEAADGLLRQLCDVTEKSVENAIKPFKPFKSTEYEIEVDAKEWEVGRARSVELLTRELRFCGEALRTLEDGLGRRRLRGAVEWVGAEETARSRKAERRNAAKARGDESWVEEDSGELKGPRPDESILEKAREAISLSSRSSALKLRLLALKSRRCMAGPEQKAFCPEAFLNVVADKLSNTSVDFINIELLRQFFYHFPTQIESGLAGDHEEVVRFARENPRVNEHLSLQEKKEKLELVAEKLDALMRLQGAKDQTPVGRNRLRRGISSLFS